MKNDDLKIEAKHAFCIATCGEFCNSMACRDEQKFIEQFSKQITAWQEDGWINVKDRYPENGQEVLFVVEPGDEDYEGSVQKGHYHRYQFSDGEIDHEFSFPSRGTRATFWMPCPEPPAAIDEGRGSI